MLFKKVLGLVDLIKLDQESRYFLVTKRLYVRAKNKNKKRWEQWLLALHRKEPLLDRQIGFHEVKFL